MAGISTTYLRRALTLRHMRLLIELDEMRHVGRVANSMHISQSAVSKSLAEIESGIGVQLFERTPRGLVPTAHGSCLVRYAQIMINEVARATDEMAGIELGASSVVSVGVMPGGTSSILPRAIVQSRKLLPGLVASVSEGPMELLFRQLRAGKLDLVVGTISERPLPADLVQTPLYSDPLVAVCSPVHPLARTRRPTLGALQAQPWVLPARTARLRDNFETAFRRMGLAPPVVLAETVSLEVTIGLLLLEPALALAQQRVGRRHAATGELHIIDAELTGLVMPVAAFSLTGAPQSAGARALTEGIVDAAARN